jgi:hypothetical protein
LEIHEATPELREALERADGKTLPYACVQGITRALNNVLKSRFHGNEGVIRSHTFTEHKSKRTQGYWWVEVKNSIVLIIEFRIC